MPLILPDAPPNAPSLSDPATFPSRAQAFLAWFKSLADTFKSKSVLVAGDAGLLNTAAPLLADIDSHTIPAGIYSVSNAVGGTAGTLPAKTTVADLVLVMKPTHNQTTQLYFGPNFSLSGTNFIRKSTSDTGWGAWRPLTAESGGNANGDYVRHPDGTLECWHNIAATSTSGETVWTYPVAATSGARVTATCISAAAQIMAPRLVSRSLTSVNVSVFDKTDARIAASVDLHMIARWY